MYRAVIAVVDASRARLFTFERTADAEGLHEGFYERADLVNMARRRRPSELFSDTRPGTNRNHRFQYAFDDHRDAHIRRIDEEFARQIAVAIDSLVRETSPRRVIVCASPRMLGELRALLAGQSVAIDALARDLVKLSASQLRDHLATDGLLPTRPRRARLVGEA